MLARTTFYQHAIIVKQLPGEQAAQALYDSPYNGFKFKTMYEN